MNRHFNYDLHQILKAPPIDHPGNFDGIIFRYSYDTEEQANGILFTVRSETTADINGLKIFPSTSIYFIPFEQPTPGDISNNILTELIYQHLSRDTYMIFNVSHGQRILKPPTLKNIIDTLIANEN